MKTWKNCPQKLLIIRPIFFQYCHPAQNQPKSQFLLKKLLTAQLMYNDFGLKSNRKLDVQLRNMSKQMSLKIENCNSKSHWICSKTLRIETKWKLELKVCGWWLQSKSLYISHVVSNFYGTDIENCASIWRLRWRFWMQSVKVATKNLFELKLGLNVSTTPITAIGCRQCLPLSVV